jgi:hypothetical protein
MDTPKLINVPKFCLGSTVWSPAAPFYSVSTVVNQISLNHRDANSSEEEECAALFGWANGTGVSIAAGGTTGLGVLVDKLVTTEVPDDKKWIVEYHVDCSIMMQSDQGGVYRDAFFLYPVLARAAASVGGGGEIYQQTSYWQRLPDGRSVEPSPVVRDVTAGEHRKQVHAHGSVVVDQLEGSNTEEALGVGWVIHNKGTTALLVEECVSAISARIWLRDDRALLNPTVS